jgi:tRNA-dihydrouridine synthase A
MFTMNVVKKGKESYLDYNEEEHPVALQIGGNNPRILAQCARLAENYGYDEINFNVGCPSNRVKNGYFGACLMSNAALVSDCIKSMLDVVNIPVTVKTRIGIDDHDSYDFLSDFIDRVSRDSGCRIFIIHARKALLSGLTPKENRTIPRLDYSRVYKLKQDFPMLTLIINGGISSLGEAKVHLNYLDGVMLGRSAYHTPDILLGADTEIFGLDIPRPDPVSLVDSMCTYSERELSKGTPLGSITRHML